MTDAERLMRDFVPSLAASPFRIAPGSVDELVKIMGGERWLLEIGPGRANFTAYPDKKEITGTYAAMLSLWAVSASVLAMKEISDAAFAANLDKFVIEQGGPGSKVVEFQHLAVALIKDERALWGDSPTKPDSTAVLPAADALVNNLFFAAASFIVLHECAHIALNHSSSSLDPQKQEFEADAWAVDWIISTVSDPVEREFRILAICTALLWIGLIDGVRRGGTTHPNAARRLEAGFEKFTGLTDQSVALEITSYMLKAYFDPGSDLPQPDSAMDAFTDRLINYQRSHFK